MREEEKGGKTDWQQHSKREKGKRKKKTDWLRYSSRKKK